VAEASNQADELSREELKALLAEARKEIEQKDEALQKFQREKNGTCWSTLEDLKSQSLPLEMSDEELQRISNEIVFFRALWPKPNHVPKQEQADRNQYRTYYKTDLWGNTPKPTHEACHLVPHSKTCNKHWKPLLLFIAGKFSGSPISADAEIKLDLEVKMFVSGYCTAHGVTVWHSSLTDSPANHFMSRSQWWMDQKQGYLTIPLMNFDSMVHWSGQPYDYVFIPISSEVFVDVDACTDVALLAKHTISSKELGVVQGFETMSRTFLVYINVMKEHNLTADEKVSARKNFPQLLDLIKTLDTFPTPSLPEKSLDLRLGSFSPGVCPAPGSTVSSNTLEGHPAAHPMLWHARNANAWLTFLWNKRGKGDALFQNELGLEAMAAGGSEGCVLFPACSDVPGFSSCSLCLSNFLCSNAHLYPEIDQDQMDAVERIRESSQEEGDFAIFHEVRLSLISKLPAFPDEEVGLPCWNDAWDYEEEIQGSMLDDDCPLDQEYDPAASPASAGGQKTETLQISLGDSESVPSPSESFHRHFKVSSNLSLLCD
jgi:hypothetical protein